MMKVLIADDELPIREWLKMTVQSLDNELEVLTAGNGKDAWELYLKEKPEIIVTDIKMPRMDGLELLQKIKNADAGAYVVMLTSYGEFEYAREAIKYQANEYVLKNEITTDVLAQILEKFYQNKNAMIKMQHGYLKDMVESGKIDTAFTKEETEHQIFAAAFVDSAQGRESFESYLNSFVERIESVFYEEGVSIWVCFCKKIPSTVASFHEGMSFCQKLSGLKEESIGYSGFSSSMLEACLCARKAWNLGFYEERKTVYIYKPDDDKSVQKIHTMRKHAVTFLRQGRREEAEEEIRELIEELKKIKLQDLELVYSCFMDLVDTCRVANIEFASHELEVMCRDSKRQIQQAKSFMELEMILKDFFEKLEGVMRIQENPYSNYIKSALSYVEDHYATVESLAEVAGYVNLNAEYFCRLFKSEVGTTFNSYLTEYRIKKAVDLLSKTDLKVYEVAEKVGYANLSYFSRVFKKITGENPFFYKK